jgi:hypothetical protein
MVMPGTPPKWWHRPIPPTRRNQIIGVLLVGGVAAVLLSLPPVLLARDADMRTIGSIGLGLGAVLTLLALGLWRFWPADQRPRR